MHFSSQHWKQKYTILKCWSNWIRNEVHSCADLFELSTSHNVEDRLNEEFSRSTWPMNISSMGIVNWIGKTLYWTWIAPGHGLGFALYRNREFQLSIKQAHTETYIYSLSLLDCGYDAPRSCLDFPVIMAVTWNCKSGQIKCLCGVLPQQQKLYSVSQRGSGLGKFWDFFPLVPSHWRRKRKAQPYLRGCFS